MGRWITFTPTGRFDFDGKSIKKLWPRLHACDQEVLPASPELLNAWARFHSGHFEDAYRLGLKLGHSGATVANQAACTYATQLERDEVKRQALYEAAAERADQQLVLEPHNANAHYALARALGHYSQSISVAKALAQGLGGRIKTALETAIALQPLHADAHFALGAFHADIIDKVGELIGNMAFGVRRDTSLQVFQQGFALQPESPYGLMAYATALLMLEGDVRQDEAAHLCARAASQPALDAREYLDVALAKNGLPS